MNSKIFLARLVSGSYIIVICLFVLLSFTQVDLNLTLLNWSPYLEIQKNLTWLGYFNRGVNGALFTILFIALLTGYFSLIKLARLGLLNLDHLIKLASVVSILLLFSYTVFSHDLFNYIFDARILTFYGQNPYLHKALDYPQDNWIRFMQWTHRTYPYGPAWLFIISFPSLLGLSKLLPTYLLFKFVFCAFYNFMLVYTVKILKLRELNPRDVATAFALLAFNPLILIDGLVSSRIDLVMASLATIAIYSHLKYSLIGNSVSKDRLLSYFWLVLSAGTKFATLMYLPVFIVGFKRLKEQWFFLSLFVLALISAPLQIYLRGLQPWYFILPFSILPFMYPRWKLKTILFITIILLLPLSAYLHFIYTGISKDALWFLSP